MRFEVVTGAAAAFVALAVAHQQDVQDAKEFVGWSQEDLDAKWGMDVRHCTRK